MLLYWIFVGENEPGELVQFVAHAKNRADALIMLFRAHGLLCLLTDQRVEVEIPGEFGVGYFVLKPRKGATFVAADDITYNLHTFRFIPIGMKILRSYKMSRILED